MKITWDKADRPHPYYYGKTGSRFSAQIGLNSELEGFVWVIFHNDFRYAVYGEPATTLEEAMSAAEKWLNENSKETNLEWGPDQSEG